MVKRQSNGFSVVEVVVVIFAALAVAVGGWYIWHKHNASPIATKKATNNATHSNKQVDSKSQQNNIVDPYEGWQTFSNTTYGISFRYPSGWSAEGLSVTPSGDGLTKVEYVVNLKRSEQVKYNGTATLEILQQSLKDVEGVYDSSSSAATVKTTDDLKGRESVQYNIPSTDEPTKRYLFGVGNKTYVLSSLNEWLNVQNDSNYWDKFSKVLDSLQITAN